MNQFDYIKSKSKKQLYKNPQIISQNNEEKLKSEMYFLKIL